MNFIEDFFTQLSFDFNRDFISKKILIGKKIFKLNLYNSLNPTKTSFYILLQEVSENEFLEIKKIIWNENKVDLFFTFNKKESSNLLFNDSKDYCVNLYYAKSSPKTQNEILDSFSGVEKDKKKLSQINKWQFDSGAFWFNYRQFLNRIKKTKGIDAELVTTLKRLKNALSESIKEGIKVQALIDRTLYIKYLEDNHIINSYFYKFYFEDNSLNYKKLLKNGNPKELNKLFSIIHKIFGNKLFDKPIIEEEYLNTDVCDLIYKSISGDNIKTGQLSLFDFLFDRIPIEFISYIYEVFLSEEQKENGIYYTPKKLAQLIIDDVIPSNKIGKVLDPSCGSGMFLIVAFNKLLENSNFQNKNLSVSEKITYRIKLLSENIFGIEKKTIAQRFTLFSLSLQVFKDIDHNEIKEYIANQLKDFGEVKLFNEYSFFDNICCANSLDVNDKRPFRNNKFDYIVGNPPFFEIKQEDEEISFINDYQTLINSEEVKAKNVVGKQQISQCFFLKIKDWSKPESRFGFVSNNSNFYNDNSLKFQQFFYKNYSIEKIYELSKVKGILFEKAKESVNALIFNNSISNKSIEYFPVKMGFFSEKPFELLIINEDDVIPIEQEKLINKDIRLRDFLIGNEFDWELINKIRKSNLFLSHFVLKKENEKPFVHRGLEVVGAEEVKKEFKVSNTKWSMLSRESQKEYFALFRKKYFREVKDNVFKYPYIKKTDINHFIVKSVPTYISGVSNFHRKRTEDLFVGDRILWNRIGGLKALFVSKSIYFDFDIYVLKLINHEYYYLFTAILNSKLITYFINIFLRKRVGSSFPKIGIDDILQIPIPRILDERVISEISKISKDLTKEKYTFTGEIEEKLNDLVFKLYDLSFIEKQRVLDYFKVKSKVAEKDLNLYKETLLDSLEIYFNSPIKVETYKDIFNLIITKISFNSNESPSSNKVAKFSLNEIFKQNPTENFFTSQEKIFGDNVIYILKKDDNTNWTETKAYEDGQDILNKLN